MMALAALITAEAKHVKFQVDMTGQTVSANGVHMAGDFQAAAGFPGDWDPATTALSNGGSGDIYSVVVDIPTDAFYRFKFINGNSWNEVEGVPAICQKGHANNGQGDDNRWWYVEGSGTDTMVVPAIQYGGSAPAGMFAVRLSVDMKNQTVGVNGVHVAGTIVFPNWTPSANAMANLFPANNKVYEYISYIAAGGYEYKFVNGNDWNAPSSPEQVPGTCANGSGNRVITVSADVATKVCFSACSECPSSKYPLVFLVDMSNSDCDGGFDSVTVTGAGARLTDFGAGIRMMELGTSKIFAIAVDSLDSGTVAYKFRKHKDGITGWEDGSNREFMLQQADTVDLTCFGSRDSGSCAPKPAPSDITFVVDLRDTIPGTVFVMGTFQTPNWQDGAIRMSTKPGYPGVYQVTVTNICPGKFNYKFVNAIDGDSSKDEYEENFPDVDNRGCVEPSGVGGYNRVYTRTSTDPVTLAYKFNYCTTSTVGVSEVGLSSTFKLFPNPAQTYTTIEFNDHATSHDVMVMDITGKVVLTYRNQTQNAVVVSTDVLSKGMYFIKATNTRNESVTSKLIVR